MKNIINFFKKNKNKKFATSVMMYINMEDEVKYCHTIHYVVAPDEIEAKAKAVELAYQMQPDYEVVNVISLEITDKL